MREAAATRPAARLTPPYFGWMFLGEALRFAAVHTRHPARQLGEGAGP